MNLPTDKSSTKSQEEIISTPKLRGFFHLIGAIISIPAGIYLYDHAQQGSSSWAAIVYAISLFTLMTSSTLYHVPRWSIHTKALLRRVDHAMIYVLILGSLTPFLSALGEHCPLYVIVLAIGNATLGVIRSLFMKTQPRVLRVISYLIMALITCLLLPKVYHVLGSDVFIWLLMGGIFYAVGAYIYAVQKPNPIPKTLGFHELFHLFVNFAATCHFIAIWQTFDLN